MALSLGSEDGGILHGPTKEKSLDSFAEPWVASCVDDGVGARVVEAKNREDPIEVAIPIRSRDKPDVVSEECDLIRPPANEVGENNNEHHLQNAILRDVVEFQRVPASFENGGLAMQSDRDCNLGDEHRGDRDEDLDGHDVPAKYDLRPGRAVGNVTAVSDLVDAFKNVGAQSGTERNKPDDRDPDKHGAPGQRAIEVYRINDCDESFDRNRHERVRGHGNEQPHRYCLKEHFAVCDTGPGAGNGLCQWNWEHEY